MVRSKVVRFIKLEGLSWSSHSTAGRPRFSWVGGVAAQNSSRVAAAHRIEGTQACSATINR